MQTTNLFLLHKIMILMVRIIDQQALVVLLIKSIKKTSKTFISEVLV